MPNKYLYLSSENSNDHAEFECDLPNGISITPYSQLRVLSCRLNIDKNIVTIDDSNNIFYISVDHWTKLNSTIPMLKVTLEKGEYDVTSTTNSQLAEMIENKINEVLNPYCFVRNGISVEMADRKLTIKSSAMEVYVCPDIDLTDEVLDYWKSVNFHSLNQDGIDYKSNKTLVVKSDVNDYQGNTFKGVQIKKAAGAPSIYMSPPLVTGLTQTDANAKFHSHSFDLDFTGLVFTEDDELQEGEEVGATKLKVDEYIRLCFGECTMENLQKKQWGEAEQWVTSIMPLDETQIYNIDLRNNEITIVTNEIINGVSQTVKYTRGTGGDYKMNSEFRFTFMEYESDSGSFHELKCFIKNNNTGGNFNELNFRQGAANNKKPFEDHPQCVMTRQATSSSFNNIGIIMNTTARIRQDQIRYTAAIDDPDKLGVGFLSSSGSFGVNSATSANTNRLFSILVDNINSNSNLVSDTIRNYFKDALSNSSMTANDDIDIDQLLEEAPNGDFLSFDALSGKGIQITDKSYQTGLVSEKEVKTTDSDFPLYYLSIPSLPIRNYSASDGHGTENQFVASIELVENSTSSFYSSQIYTEQYNVLQNAQDLEIDKLSIRVTDINGVKAEGLKKYSTIVLEIKDDPRVENELLLKNIKLLMDRQDTVPQVMK